ncbi:STM4015 family protein [Kibdelosporangium persicum]|uniref:Leucine-rich repeat domain-containing protein n=1 Tax=Kibdelosporangium persicum TaxID=2698649 RepID=A0ABX2FBZ5_9PSEU|nr:STM4015 family protein [Kibdelosporangium persicum]NRN68901.1 Leucine-rich repeat domain-containing protein [Kibdelosporangium persicum]
MQIHEHLSTFHGSGVTEFTSADVPGTPTWFLGVETWDSDETFEQLWRRFLTTVDTSAVRALVIGNWGEAGSGTRSGTVIDLLLAEKDRFPALTGLFLGDIIGEENEISWIEQDDITPLLRTFPALTELAVRGGNELELHPVRHENLQVLRIETGGMPSEAVAGVAQSDLPALRELRLWLGVDEYGGDWRPEDLEPLLAGDRLPSLRVLGLQNSDRQDHVCELVAQSAIVRRLETLDLSMGILTDEGGQHLLSLTHLRNLDLHHHFLSERMRERLREALESKGVLLNLDEALEPEHYNGRPYYYTAVSE